METYLDGTGYNTYGIGNQYPEVGYWILRGDTILVPRALLTRGATRGSGQRRLDTVRKG